MIGPGTFAPAPAGTFDVLGDTGYSRLNVRKVPMKQVSDLVRAKDSVARADSS